MVVNKHCMFTQFVNEIANYLISEKRRVEGKGFIQFIRARRVYLPQFIYSKNIYQN